MIWQTIGVVGLIAFGVAVGLHYAANGWRGRGPGK